MSAGPALSVVLVADDWTTVRRTVSHVAAQSVADRIELVVVVPRGVEVPADPPEAAGLFGVRRVETESIASMEWARAPGVLAATAPLVVLGETHSFPQPGWAEALIAAAGEGYAVVGPRVVNANPEQPMSWANLLLDYGPWLGGERRELADLPGHNSAYRAEVVRELGDELPELLEAEFVLHARLAARGHRLLWEPAAATAHLNVTRLRPMFAERFHAGRRFAAARARELSPLRRLVYVAGSPLIPLVRLPRCRRHADRAGLRGALPPRVLPWLLLGLVVSAAGELVGYVTGPGNSMYRLGAMELHKERFLRPEPS